MNIELDPDHADKVVLARLAESASYLKDDINRLVTKGGLNPAEKEDVQYMILDLHAVNRVLVMFGGKSLSWTDYIPYEQRAAG
jgi:hypothetical protein